MAAVLGACAFLLGVAHVATLVLARVYPANPVALELYRLLNLGSEANIPTWYGTLLWLLAALEAWRLADSEPEAARYWRGASAVALFLSMDEAAMWHEGIGDLIRYLWLSFPTYTWMLYGAVFAIGCGVAFWPLFRRLDGRTKSLLVTAAAMFAVGSFGLEGIEGYFALKEQHFPVGTEVWAEETLEMAAVILLVYALRRRRGLAVSA